MSVDEGFGEAGRGGGGGDGSGRSGFGGGADGGSGVDGSGGGRGKGLGDSGLDEGGGGGGGGDGEGGDAEGAGGGLGEGDGSGDDTVQYWQLSWQPTMRGRVLHLMILSKSVLTSRWQNSASWSTHAGGGDGGGGDGGGGDGGGGDGGGCGEAGGGGGDCEGASGWLGEGDGSGDDKVQCPQLSWQATMSSQVWHLKILWTGVLTSRWQNSASLSTHAGGDGDGGGDGEAGASGRLRSALASPVPSSLIAPSPMNLASS